MGKLLRKTSLDELPELFNVLKGNKEFGKREDVLFKYYWDRTEALYNLPLFNQDIPVGISPGTGHIGVAHKKR